MIYWVYLNKVHEPSQNTNICAKYDILKLKYAFRKVAAITIFFMSP